MPSFDFQCQECGHEFIDIVADPKETYECLECGEKAAIRVWRTMPGITRVSEVRRRDTNNKDVLTKRRLKRAAHLEVEKDNYKEGSQEKKEVQREIDALKKL